MGLHIIVLKPVVAMGEDDIKKLNEEDLDKVVHIYSLQFPPFRHLTKFSTGDYMAEVIESPRFHVSYGFFNDFRRWVARVVYNMSLEDIWKLSPNLRPFVGHGELAFMEFFNFADNEGCFDYVVAEKLYNDFVRYRDKMVGQICQYMYYYDRYTEILRIAAENKAVAYYH